MDQNRLQDLLARIEKYPGNVLDRFVLAKMYHSEGLWKETMEACRPILELKPDYLVVMIMLGESLLQLNQKTEARLVLEKAKEVAVAQKHTGMIPEIDDLLDQI